MADDGWDVFGGQQEAAPAPPAVDRAAAGTKRARAAGELADALRPFHDADGQPMAVPETAEPPLPAEPFGLWPDHPTLVALGAVELRALPEFGGARGIVAASDLAVGSLILAERPLVAWPDGAEHSPLPLLREVLRSPQRDEALRAMRKLHPERLEDVPRAERARLAELHAATLDALVPLLLTPAELAAAAAEAPPSDRIPRARDELLRHCLAVQWNAFGSGLFLHSSLFNHAPARRANADKATVAAAAAAGEAATALPRPGGLSGSDKLLSVVRATRPIRRGEQV